MAKVSDKFVSLNAVTSSGAGTAVNTSRVEAWTSSVSYTSTGGTVNIIIEGTLSAVSTSGYVDISNVTTTGATSGSYDVSKSLTPYRYVRVRTLSHGSTGTVVTANILTQVEV